MQVTTPQQMVIQKSEESWVSSIHDKEEWAYEE